MAATALTDRYAANLHGVLSCYDRIIVTGTLPGACYAGGLTSFLYSRGIRIFDYPRLAEPLRERIRERAQQVCETAGVQIEHVNKSHIRKEDLVARVLAARGDAPGLVHVISAMEACPSYKPWLDKRNGHEFVQEDNAFLRVGPTWGGRRRWPTRSTPSDCTGGSSAMRTGCARWPTYSPRTTGTGASARPNTPPT
jgi:hypothetical protein